MRTVSQCSSSVSTPTPPNAFTPEYLEEVPRCQSLSYHHLNPSWRVASMELVDPYGWHLIDGQTLLYIREKLAYFKTMTWREILVRAKKQNHSISVGDLSPEAQQR
jgi:hypothetical protein